MAPAASVWFCAAFSTIQPRSQNEPHQAVWLGQADPGRGLAAARSATCCTKAAPEPQPTAVCVKIDTAWCTPGVPERSWVPLVLARPTPSVLPVTSPPDARPSSGSGMADASLPSI